MIISPFPLKILIPIQNLPSFIIRASFVLLLLIISSIPISCSCFCSLPATIIIAQNQPKPTMKVHPLPKKRNITVQYDFNNNNNLRNPSAGSLRLSGGSNKKLRRLPHIFSRVLELPFRSDADVSVEEGPDCFRFVAETEDIGHDVRAHTIEIYPGVTKIVIRPNGYLGLSSLDELELDMWRFRLPETTLPELASAVCVDGELIVTVPKGENVEGGGGEGQVWGDGGGNGEFRGGMGNSRLVLVQ